MQETKRGLLCQETKLIRSRDQIGNNSKVNLAKCCYSINGVIRRHRARWQQCSGTRSDQRDLGTTPELKFRLWLKDQSQRTVQQANVNLCWQHWTSLLKFSAEYDESHISEETTSTTTRTKLSSRTNQFWQVLQARSKSSLSLQMTKRLREISIESERMH